MDTAPEFDAILGLDWMRQYNICLNPTDNIAFGWNADAGTVLHFEVPQDLQFCAYNVRLNFCSASAVADAIKSKQDQVYLIHLQHVPDAHINANSSDKAVQPADDSEYSPELSKAVHAVVNEYADVFPAELPAGLPPVRPIAHAIPLQPGSQPPAQKLYRLS